MEGQLSFDDLEKSFCTQVIFADGYSEIREYDEPSLHMWDDLIARHGIIINYRQIRGIMDGMEWQEPCHGYCSCAWGSLKCFLKRGYIRHDGKWCRDENGEILIAKQKECHWIPREGTE